MNRFIHTALMAAAWLAAANAAATAATAEQFRVRLQVVEACTVIQASTVGVTCALRSPYRIQAVGGLTATPAGRPLTMLEVFF
ncbi:hypothetical protein E5S69_00735 [Cupriavidus necator]|uniref:hypothetical protein n=1 Tax=Cupriavidus necator TaxID=106590 RepID=UPI00148F728B|nr:hypothetical protein [Cupriavidus necator]NOV22054.1 hypothetical protein [Cupriavidus necator]